MFFQWRQSRAGSEKHHSGMLPHRGTDTRIWRDVKALGADLRQLDELLASQVPAEAALLMDWDNWWALELGDKPSNDLRLLPQFMGYYAPLFRRNIPVDFAHPEADLSGYKLSLAPSLSLVSGRAAQNVQRYVQNGGTLVMAFFSGVVDEHEHLWPGGHPAPLRETLGIEVEEYVPYAEAQTNGCVRDGGERFGCSVWSDVIRLAGARALATYERGYYAGSPAITQHAFGHGTAFYVGTVPDQCGTEWLLAQACRTAGIGPVVPNAPAGVELVRRTNGTHTWLLALNYASETVHLPLAQPGVEVLSGRRLDGSVSLGPLDVAIIKH
jgi:beta-galactosidase